MVDVLKLLKYKRIALTLLVLWVSLAYYAQRHTTQLELDADLGTTASYLKKKPLSVGEWLVLADRASESGNTLLRNQALDSAAELATHRTFYLEPTLAKFLQYKRFTESRPIARRILEISAKKLNPIFELLHPVVGTDVFVSQVLPQQDSSGNLDRSFYLTSLLNHQIKRKDASMFTKVWQAYSEAERSSLITPDLFKVLARLKKIDGGYSAQSTIVRSFPGSIQFTGAPIDLPFERQSRTSPLCWDLAFLKDTKWTVTNRVMRAQMPATKKRGGHVLNCYIPVTVDKDMTIQLSGWWENKTTIGKAYSSVSFTTFSDDGLKQLVKSKRQRQKESWSREPINLALGIDKHTRGVSIIVKLPRYSTPAPDALFSLSELQLQCQETCYERG